MDYLSAEDIALLETSHQEKEYPKEYNKHYVDEFVRKFTYMRQVGSTCSNMAY